MFDDPHTVARAAYAVLKRHVREQHPADQLVAIKWGRVVADAESFEQLEAKLVALRLAPSDVVIERAGYETEVVEEYPGWTMMEAIYGHWNECMTPPSEA